MKKEVVGIGSTIEDAREDAIKKLDAPENIDVKIEVVQRAVKKTFGLFGGAPAKVKAYYEVSESPKDIAVDYIKNILKAFGVQNVNIKSEEEGGNININIDSEDNGIIIGRRGETIDAIQQLAGIAANNNRDSFCRVTVNIADYQIKKESTIKERAKRTAVKVVKYGRSIALEPMNSYERRLVHTVVQEVKGAVSNSVGEKENRRVVISPEQGGKPSPAGRDRRPARNGDRNRSRATNPRQPQNRGKTLPANAGEKKKDVENAPLYGRLD